MQEALTNHNSYYEVSDFQLDDDDVYDARCAEIFITFKRVLVFHCSLCDRKYGSSEYLLEHLSVEHFGTIEEQEEFNIRSSTRNNFTFETRPEENIKAEFKEVSDNSDNGSLGPLEETLHEYDELQYAEKMKIEEKYESDKIDEYSNSELSHDGEEYLEKIESVVVEPQINDYEINADKVGLEEKLPVGKRQSRRFESSAKVKRKSLANENKNEEHFKPLKENLLGLFKCDICSKTFHRKKNMSIHLITHSSERKHKCEYCGFAFKDRSNLMAHIRRCHKGQKNISCDICLKKFFTKNESESHMRTHTGEKPYICSFCGLAFQTASKLTAHSKRHTENAPLQCNYCEKRFWVKQGMDDHLLVHTKEKPFACPICSARFPRRKSMLRHTKLHEKEGCKTNF